MRRVGSLAVLAPLLLVVASCTGTTGYQLVSFYAAVQGPADAQAGQPYTFATDRGFRVTLTKAVIHVGGLYLDESQPVSVSAEYACTLPGTYTAEVRGGADFDMISPALQAFPVSGDGSTIPSLVGQVWLTGGDVYAADDSTPVLTLQGSVHSDGGFVCDHALLTTDTDVPFAAQIVIDRSRFPAPTGNATPGANPPCEQRIVTPIPAPITLSQSGTLILHVDPTALFLNADLGCLTQYSKDPPSYGIPNDESTQPSRNLYSNLRSAGAVYRFEFRPASQ